MIVMSFNINKDSTKVVDVDQKVSVMDKSKQCAPVAGNANRKIGVKIGVEAKAHAQVDYGVVASGSIIPPVCILQPWNEQAADSNIRRSSTTSVSSPTSMPTSMAS